ncbi:MAG: CHAT domain-containing protein, partial [Acidobacteriota bacterium]
WLIDRFTISYAPSLGVHHLCAQKPPSTAQRSLVLGVADERAPHILEEVRAVASSIGDATRLEGEEASEEALRLHGADRRFLHIATHGLFRPDNPMFSAIQLGTSRLSLFDLYNLKLDAQLVVLSGCGTGLNAVEGADELVGLTRGLLYAGARSVLVTLWDVHDRSTAELMRRLYGHLAAGVGPAAALRAAMTAHREDFPEPYFWAPFMLVGQPK